MLVLSRTLDEAICIGEEITITVMRVRGDKVRLGVQAPKAVLVDRAEVRRAKDKDGRKPTCMVCGEESMRLAKVDAHRHICRDCAVQIHSIAEAGHV